MTTGRAEALDIFRKWMSDGALLQCHWNLYTLAATFRVRVSAVSGGEIAFWSDDKTSELTLPLKPEFEFGYGEPERSSVEAMDSVSGLVVFLSPTGPGLDPDAIMFHELVGG